MWMDTMASQAEFGLIFVFLSIKSLGTGECGAVQHSHFPIGHGPFEGSVL